MELAPQAVSPVSVEHSGAIWALRLSRRLSMAIQTLAMRKDEVPRQ
jgi:hypothetical protein